MPGALEGWDGGDGGEVVPFFDIEGVFADEQRDGGVELAERGLVDMVCEGEAAGYGVDVAVWGLRGCRGVAEGAGAKFDGLDEGFDFGDGLEGGGDGVGLFVEEAGEFNLRGGQPRVN